MDDAERELWCRAWRLLLQHGDETENVIDTEIQHAVHLGDRDSAADWKRIALAVQQLAK